MKVKKKKEIFFFRKRFIDSHIHHIYFNNSEMHLKIKSQVQNVLICVHCCVQRVELSANILTKCEKTNFFCKSFFFKEDFHCVFWMISFLFVKNLKWKIIRNIQIEKDDWIFHFESILEKESYLSIFLNDQIRIWKSIFI